MRLGQRSRRAGGQRHGTSRAAATVPSARWHGGCPRCGCAEVCDPPILTAGRVGRRGDLDGRMTIGRRGRTCPRRPDHHPASGVARRVRSRIRRCASRSTSAVTPRPGHAVACFYTRGCRAEESPVGFAGGQTRQPVPASRLRHGRTGPVPERCGGAPAADSRVLSRRAGFWASRWYGVAPPSK
jgi:hypothetical protein